MRGAVLLVALMAHSMGNYPAKLNRQSDLELLQGDWEASVRTPVPGVRMVLRMRVEGATVTWRARELYDGPDHAMVGNLAIDSSTEPKKWDITNFTEVNTRASLPDLVGIYKLEGDNLTLCVPSSPDNRRPKEFVKDDASHAPQTVIFKRMHVSATK